MTLIYIYFSWMVPIISKPSIAESEYPHSIDVWVHINAQFWRSAQPKVTSAAPTDGFFRCARCDCSSVMNLLIAMMGGSYERVEESAVNEGLRKRAELIVEFEKSPIYRADLFYLMRSSHVDEDFYPPWLYFFRDAGATEGTANHRGTYVSTRSVGTT